VPRPAEGRFELVAPDIGQGTAVLVRTREHLLVYDAGPLYAESDAGSACCCRCCARAASGASTC
jgi:competence protein ComEC